MNHLFFIQSTPDAITYPIPPDIAIVKNCTIISHGAKIWVQVHRAARPTAPFNISFPKQLASKIIPPINA